ncbi:MAG: N-acetylmuramoyl-L-alanine amidase [Actinomycetota bacterium]
MRRLSAVLVALVVTSGCAGVAVDPPPTATRDDSSGSSTTVTLPTTSTTDDTTTTTTTPPGPPVGWIAPSGVPLAVTGVDGDTLEVLTPCGNPETLTEGTPVHEVDVLVDPGHGGPVDTGAVAATGLAEKDINLQVSQAVHQMLLDRGIDSMLTRVADYPVPIRTRTAYADHMGAEAVVSIHHNAPEAPPSDIPGVEIFVQHETPEAARLGGLIYDATMETLSQFDVDWDRAADAGVMSVLNSDQEDAYGIVRLPQAPSALVELGYIANRAEAELYADPDYVPSVATAVADAVEAFLTSSEAGSPLVEGRTFDPARGVGRDRCIEPDLHAALFPDVVDVSVSGDGSSYNFTVTMSSPYDSPERYADAWRVIGNDGRVYGIRELLHDHANEQPFTRSLEGVEIPEGVTSVTIQGRDQAYGWGGGAVEVNLP